MKNSQISIATLVESLHIYFCSIQVTERIASVPLCPLNINLYQYCDHQQWTHHHPLDDHASAIRCCRRPYCLILHLFTTSSGAFVTSCHLPLPSITSDHLLSLPVSSGYLLSPPVTSRHLLSQSVTFCRLPSPCITSHNLPTPHITSCHLSSHPVTSHHLPYLLSPPISSHHLLSPLTSSRHPISPPITSRHLPLVTPRHFPSLTVTARHLLSLPVTFCYLPSLPITSCHLLSIFPHLGFLKILDRTLVKQLTKWMDQQRSEFWKFNYYLFILQQNGPPDKIRISPPSLHRSNGACF